MRRNRLILSLSIIIFIALYFRILPLFYSFFDGGETLIVLLTLKQAIAHNFTLVPNALSGNGMGIFAENRYILIYAIMDKFLGMLFSPLEIIYLAKILLISITAICVFFFVRLIANDDFAGLWGAAFYAISPIGIWIEGFNEIRVETIVMPLLLISMLFLAYWITERKMMFLVPSILILLADMWLWNGYLYLFGIYMFALLCGVGSYHFDRKTMISLLIGITFIAYFLIFFIVMGNYFNLELGNHPQLPLSLYPFNLYNMSIDITFYVVFLIPIFITLFMFVANRKKKHLNLNGFFVVLAYFIGSLPLLFFDAWWVILLYLPLSIIMGIGTSFIYGRFRLVLFVVIFICLFVSMYYSFIHIVSMKESQFYDSQAMSWLNQFTPSNSVILTSSYNGDYVEYFGDRRSLFDDAISTNDSGFLRFLNGSQYNLSYLDAVQPSYLLINRNWDAKYGSNLALLENGWERINADNMTLSLAFSDNASLIYSISKNP